MEFKDFRKAIQDHFEKMVADVNTLFEVEVDKDEMCRKAVEGDACPNCGEQCAWSESLGE